MEIALLLLIGFALTRPLRTPLIRAATLVGLIAMALQHSRHELLLGIVGPMLLARPIAEAIGAAKAGEDWGRLARAALAASLAAALAIGAVRLMIPIERVDGTAAPISALEAVPPELRAKPVLNEYGFGGYLIWSHVRPFIDGRADMYGGPMLGLYRELSAGDPKAVEETLKRYRIAWTIFAPDTRIVATLDREPGWRRLYADRFAVVHVRDGAAPGPEGSRGDRGGRDQPGAAPRASIDNVIPKRRSVLWRAGPAFPTFSRRARPQSSASKSADKCAGVSRVTPSRKRRPVRSQGNPRHHRAERNLDHSPAGRRPPCRGRLQDRQRAR